MTQPWGFLLRWGRDRAAYPQDLQGFATLKRFSESLCQHRARHPRFTRWALRSQDSGPNSRPSLCLAPSGLRGVGSRPFGRNLRILPSRRGRHLQTKDRDRPKTAQSERFRKPRAGRMRVKSGSASAGKQPAAEKRKARTRGAGRQNKAAPGRVGFAAETGTPNRNLFGKNRSQQ